MGKEHVALWLVTELVGAKDIANFPYLHVVRPEAGKTITIEQIRQLIASMTLIAGRSSREPPGYYY